MIATGKGGYVVNTSSGAGLVNAGTGFLYTTSKFAVVGLSEALSLELEPYGIGVSVLCPGPVDTDIVRNSFQLGPDAGALSPELDARIEASTAFLRTGVSPDEVGRQVLAAIERGDLHILTDDMIAEGLRERAQQLEAALPGRPAVEVR